MGIIVATSTVADGSMFNRDNLDDPEIFENRETFLKTQNIAMSQATRVRINFDRSDFCQYASVTNEDLGKGMHNEHIQIADALITTDRDHALFLPVADCIGAAIYDPKHGVLSVAHLGRHSLEQNGAYRLINHLKDEYQSNPLDLKIWLTPAPGKDVYPIWALNNKGMKEAAFEQLFAAGVVAEHITNNTTDSDKDPNYYSYSEFLKGNREKDGDYSIVAMMTDR